ncbi:MAG: hypothetical protein A2820_03430 [Candidatus Buchananbacteria bacterium RIFCSPHIGHO2_01_FULL_40_35]|nr:MAG: hypothetical protein A2820_03430 [Candidatus Buchananbacteria bacterium RIFCSPHIGHO2_01_FULL_40_35]
MFFLNDKERRPAVFLPRKPKDNDLRVEILFENKDCLAVISGTLDWTVGLSTVKNKLEKVWLRDIKHLILDCRNLQAADSWNSLGTYFLIFILSLRRRAAKRNVEFLVYLKSREQVAVVSRWGIKIRRKLSKNLIFENSNR